MKFFGYIARNALRNPVRSSLTVASLGISLFLMMILISFIALYREIAADSRQYHRLMVMGSQGFAQPVPLSLVNQIRAWREGDQVEGVVAVSPLSWFGGRVGEERATFAQFGVDADTLFEVYDELTIPPEQLGAFRDDRAACVVGRKLAEERGLEVGDSLPLEGDIYPIDLDLRVAGIYDGPSTADLRSVFFHFDYMEESLKQNPMGSAMAGNAGTVVIKCSGPDVMPAVAQKVDAETRNSDSPTKTQTEEAFVQMFAEMLGDMRDYIFYVGMAVVFSLICVAGVAMAMAMRERTTEVAVLKAIGFGKGLVLFLVLAEATLIAGLGGVVGALGAKALFGAVDVSPYTGGFLPFFFVPWDVALLGLGVSLGIGLVSGLVPAAQAARLSVVNGLRKVV